MYSSRCNKWTSRSKVLVWQNVWCSQPEEWVVIEPPAKFVGHFVEYFIFCSYPLICFHFYHQHFIKQVVFFEEEARSVVVESLGKFEKWGNECVWAEAERLRQSTHSCKSLRFTVFLDVLKMIKLRAKSAETKSSLQ